MGRSVLLNKDYHFNPFSSSEIFGLGGNAWNFLDFDNQSPANTCVDTIKDYSIPSVPSRLKGVKTRPEKLSDTCSSKRRDCESTTHIDRPNYILRREIFTGRARKHVAAGAYNTDDGNLDPFPIAKIPFF